jgi:NDP-sugar pyrophosphorylase family protein
MSPETLAATLPKTVTLTIAPGVKTPVVLKPLATVIPSYEIVSSKGDVLGRLEGAPAEPYQLDVFHGKGGLVLVLQSPPELHYFCLPGGSIEGDGFKVELLPQPSEGIFSGSPYPLTAENTRQTVTKQAMILGAGIGSRILPLTDEAMRIAKPALPLDGEQTVISRLVLHLAKFGIERLYVNTFCHRPSVERTLRAAAQQAGIQLVEIPEDRATGTAGGLLTMLKYPEQYPNFNPEEPILIVQGDAVTTADFAGLLAFHAEKNACITIGCQNVSDEDAPKFGVIVTDKATQADPSGKMVEFLEKQTLEVLGNHRFASCGFYVLAPRMYTYLQDLYARKLAKETEAALEAGKPAPTEVQEIDFANDQFPEILEKSFKGEHDPIWAYDTKGLWCDIGNPKQYFETLRAVYEGKLGIDLPGETSAYVSPEGPLFWHGTKAQVEKDGFTLKGDVLAGFRYRA